MQHFYDLFRIKKLLIFVKRLFLGVLKYFFMTFGERILSLRKKYKWSQDQLAKKIGTSAPIIGRYERNEIKPSIETAKNIADALDVTIDYLIGGSDTMVLNKDLLRKIEDIEQFDEEDKSQIYYLLDMAISFHKTKRAFAK